MNPIDDHQSARLLLACQPAQPIFAEGERGRAMYVVQAGEVEICTRRAEGSVTLARLHKGEVFGELALVDDSPRSASAIAGPLGASVLVIDRAHFVYLVGQQPAFALVVLEVMASRMRTLIKDARESA